VRSGPGEARTILLFHTISARPSKQPRMVRTFLKVYMELGSYFLFLQEQIKDIIISRGTCRVGLRRRGGWRRGRGPQPAVWRGATVLRRRWPPSPCLGAAPCGLRLVAGGGGWCCCGAATHDSGMKRVSPKYWEPDFLTRGELNLAAAGCIH
jgi:hypothetical protein